MNNQQIILSQKRASDIKEKKLRETAKALKQSIKDPQRRSDIAGIINNASAFKDITSIEDNHASILKVLGDYSEIKKKSNLVSDKDIGVKLNSNLDKSGYFDFLNNLDNMNMQLGNTQKIQSGPEFFKNIERIEKANFNYTRRKGMLDYQSTSKAVKNLKNILNNGGHVITFDLETLGGKNSRGHQQLDFITEVSASVNEFAPGGKSNKVVDGYNTLFGFSDTEYQEVKTHIESLKSKTTDELTDQDKIMLSRFNMIADSNVKTKTNGFNVTIESTLGANESTSFNVDRALKGVDRYRKIGESQEKWVTENGGGLNYVEYKKKYVENVSDLIYSGKGKTKNYNDFVTIGQNSGLADNPWIGQTLGRTINPTPGRHLDTFQAIKYSEEFLGQGSMFEGLIDAAGNPIKTTNAFGPGSQDQLMHVFKSYFEDVTGQAHNANVDEQNLKHIISNNTPFAKRMFDNFDKMDVLMKKKSGTFEFGKNPGVFMMGSSSQLATGNKNGAMSFAYNPISKSFKTYDGFEIAENGSVDKAGFHQYGPKKNALYTHDAYKIDLKTKEWKEQFSKLGMSESQMDKFYQEYSTLDSLTILRSKEYRNPKLVEKKFGKNSVLEESDTFFRVLTSQEQLATAMGVHVGDLDENGNLSWFDDVLEDLDFKITDQESIGGKVNVRKASIEDTKAMILNKSMNTTTVESGARAARDMSYTKLEKIRQYNINNNLKVSERLAQLQAQGKAIDLNVNAAALEEFGWFDYSNKEMKVVSESLKKATVLDQYVKDMDPIFKAINSVFGEMNLDDSFTTELREDGINVVKAIAGSDMKTVNAKKDWLFKKATNDILEQISNSPSKINRSQTVIQTAEELNKIDFNTYDLFPELLGETKRAGFANTSSEVTSIDLGQNDSLLNAFYKQTDPRLDKKGPAGYSALHDAYMKIGADERFKGVWGDLTEDKVRSYQREGQNISTLNAKMTNKLKEFVNAQRKTPGNEGFGLLFSREMQDPTRLIGEIASIANKKDDTFLNMAREAISNIDLNVLTSGDILSENKVGNSKLIDEIVDKYFMTFSKDDLVKSLDGYTDQQKNVLLAQYDLSKKQARSSALEIVQSIKETDLQLTIEGTGRNSKMFMSKGNDIRTINAHKYVQDNGIINTLIGDQEYATQFTLNANNYIKYGKPSPEDFSLNKHLTFTNNVEAVIQKTTSLDKVTERAIKENRSILDDITYSFNKRANKISESSPRKEVGNFSNVMERAFHVDTNAMIGILPELKDNGIIDNINKDYNISAKHAKMFDEVIEKIRKGDIRPESIREILANDKNLYFQLYKLGLNEEVMEGLNYEDMGSDVDLKKVFSRLNTNTKNTALVDGLDSINDSPFAHGLAFVEKSTRPPQFQIGNVELKDKNKLKADIKKGLNGPSGNLYKTLDVNSIVSNKASEKWMFNAGRDKNLSAGLTMKFLQIDSNSLTGILEKDVKKARENTSSKFSKFLEGRGFSPSDSIEGAKVLAERSMKLSSYEQESIMNSRVAYLNFGESNVQTISGKKELLLNHKKNLDVIENLKENVDKLIPIIDENGRIVYTTGFEVKRGQTLGLFGKEATPKQARWDGVFRSRFFQNGEMVSEDELNNSIKDIMKNKNNISHDDIIKELNKQFDLKYQVIQKYDNHGKKLMTNATEKSTMDAMDIRIGTIDKGLMPELRSKLAGTGIDAESLSGTVLDKEYIEGFLRPNIGDSLTERMLSERFLLGDSLNESFDQLKGIHMYGALDEFKHESVSMPLVDFLEKAKNLPDRDDYYNAVLGKDNWSWNEGKTSIITDDVNKLKVRGFTSNDFDGDEIKAAKMNYMLKSDVIKDAEGKVIGNVKSAHVFQLRDDEAGTYAGNVNVNETAKDLRQVEKKIRSSTLSAKDKLNLEHQAQGMRSAIDKATDYKGVKYSKHMNNLLQRAVYDQDSMGLTHEKFNKMGIDSEFSKYFGHAVNADGVVKEEMLGKSILDPITSNMRSYLKLGYGETLLADVDKMDSKTKAKYHHISDSFKDMKNEVSLERAEQVYSVNQGLMAIDYNNTNTSPNRRRQLMSNGPEHSRFKEVDLTDRSQKLSLDIGGLGKTITDAPNNPYTNNLMIKYGENKYVAIPRMPEVHFEDNLIKADHISKLSSLQSIMDDINSGTLKGEDLSKKQNQLVKVVDQIKSLQKKDITSKTGLVGEVLETRLSQSFFGKASGITINALGKNVESMKKLDRGQYYKDLVDANSNVFTKAEFDGKNLLQHFSEGKVLDHVFASEGAFRDMGYFDEDFMSDIFKKMDSTQDNMKEFLDNSSPMEERMKRLLEKHGDSFISVRYPELQEGSDKVLMGYLDRDLKGNQIRVTGHTGLSMKLDHDGDQAALARVTNRSRESMLDYTVATASASNGLKDEVIATKSSMMKRAVIDNHYWNSKVQERIKKEHDLATLAKVVDEKTGRTMTSLEAVAQNNIIDNDIFTSVIPSEEMTTRNMSKLSNEYGEQVTRAFKEKNHDGVIAELRQKAIDASGSFNQEAFELEKQKYATAYSFKQLKDANLAKSSNQSIGEIDITNKKVNGLLQRLIDPKDERYDYKTRLMTDFAHLSEEAAISAKSSTEALDPDRAKVWNTFSKDMITGKGNKLEIEKGMRDWSEKYIHKDLDLNMYFATNQTFRDKAKKAFNVDDFDTESFASFISNNNNEKAVTSLKQDMTNDYVNMISALRETPHATKILQQQSVGQSQKGVVKGTKDMVSTAYETNEDELFRMLEGMNSPNQDLNFIKLTDKLNEQTFSSGSAASKILKSSERNSTKKSVSHAILEGAGNIFKGIGTSGLAMGALGIAASVLAIGYVGGRPRPADVHAMEESQNSEGQMSNGQYSLADPGLNFRQGSSNGYVVNINARTDKSKDNAVSAIQEAISSGTSSNINLSMNIRDNYGNINDRDLQDALAGVFN